ncbi:MAG: hypothetical protein K6C99_09275 [Lachnospiraceae bacterium]|nr:hypothetical protein [Lachnospiraceae bacterium]
MNSITYVHFSLDELLSVGENADMAQDSAFLYISLIFMSVVISMFASFLILRNSRKEKSAGIAEISGGLLESVKVSGVSTTDAVPNISVNELIGYFNGNADHRNVNRMNPNQNIPDQTFYNQRNNGQGNIRNN